MKEVTTTQATIGRLLADSVQERDAIHIAVAPVVAGEILQPGWLIRVKDGKAVAAISSKAQGIVDPFLRGEVMAGERFWLFLLPNTVTSMRHEWGHPDFPPGPISSESERWLRDFARRHHGDYEHIVRWGRGLEEEEPGFGTTSGPEEAQSPEFWQHLEVVTGRTFSEETRRDTYFHCAC